MVTFSLSVHMQWSCAGLFLFLLCITFSQQDPGLSTLHDSFMYNDNVGVITTSPLVAAVPKLMYPKYDAPRDRQPSMNENRQDIWQQIVKSPKIP